MTRRLRPGRRAGMARKERGYVTGGFLANGLLGDHWGFAQGFDEYVALWGQPQDETHPNGQKPRGETSQAIPGHLREAAVGVQERHRGSVRRAGVHDEAVRADARVPIAKLPRQAVEWDPVDRVPLDVEEIVAVGVGLHKSDRLLV